MNAPLPMRPLLARLSLWTTWGLASVLWLLSDRVPAMHGDPQAQARSPRHLVLGRIDDEDGSWNSAQVILVSTPRLEGIEDLDACKGRQGSKRGILARLQTGRSYRAAARLDREGKPSLWTSIEEIPVGTTRFELRPRLRPPIRPRIRVQGQERWKTTFPTQLRLRDALGRSRLLGDCLDAEARLPSLPGSLCWVEFCTESGRRLQLFPIALKKRGAPDEVIIRIPPPLRIDLRVLDASRDAPVEGALVFEDRHRPEAIDREVLRSDAQGWARLWIPRPTDAKGDLDPRSSLLFRVLHEGYGLSCAGWNTRHAGASGPIPGMQPDGNLFLEVRLKPLPALSGRLVGFEDKGLRGLQLFTRMQSMMPAARGGERWTSLPWMPVQVDAQGRYRLPRLSKRRSHYRFRLFFPDALHRQIPFLATEGKALGPSESLLDLPPGKMPAGPTAQLPDIDGRLLRLLDLRVRLGDGTRGRDIPIYVLPDDADNPRMEAPLFGWFDARGRYRRLQYGPLPVLFVQGPRSYAILGGALGRPLPIPEKGKASVIELQPMPTIRGRVQHADGRPESRARVRLRTKRFLAQDKNQHRRALQGLASQTEVPVDAEGRFEVAFLPFPDRILLLDASWRTPKGVFHYDRQELALDHGDEVLLTFPK